MTKFVENNNFFWFRDLCHVHVWAHCAMSIIKVYIIVFETTGTCHLTGDRKRGLRLLLETLHHILCRPEQVWFEHIKSEHKTMCYFLWKNWLFEHCIFDCNWILKMKREISIQLQFTNNNSKLPKTKKMKDSTRTN